MADFCNQCAIEDGLKSPGDPQDYTSGREPVKPGMGYLELCEGCGGTFVDHLGNCLGWCDKLEHQMTLRKVTTPLDTPRLNG